MHSVNTTGDVPDAESSAGAWGTNALLQRPLRPPAVMSPRVVARTTSRYQVQADGGKVPSGFASLCLEPALIP